MNPTIKIKLDAGATMPRYAHPTDVGADVTALRTWLVELDGTEHELQTYDDCFNHIYTKCTNYSKLKIDTGVHAQPPAGYYIELVPNSRIAKSPFMFANSIGIIDPTYTGSMRVVLNVVHIITADDLAQFLPGRVVGQLIVRKQHQASFTQVDTLDATERGAGGFGSTAKQQESRPCANCAYAEDFTMMHVSPACLECKNYDHFTAKLPLDSWHPLPAESGQQSNLTPTDGQQMHQDLFNTNGN